MAEIQAFLAAFTPGAVGIWGLFAFVVVVFLKMRPAMAKIGSESDASLRADLLKRISEVESAAAAERRDCDQRLHALQERLDAVMRQFLAFQMAVARAVPPLQRSEEIDHMLEQLRNLEAGK